MIHHRASALTALLASTSRWAIAIPSSFRGAAVGLGAGFDAPVANQKATLVN
jgi:hypothetical protein